MISSKVCHRLLTGVTFTLLFSTQLPAQAQQPSPAKNSKTAKHGPPEPVKPSEEFTLVGAGDIAWCGNMSGAEGTAKLIDNTPGTVFAAGDLVYDSGSWEEFQNCYQPTWGKFKDRTRPAPGNHEYQGSPATGYFRYWGAQAGDPKKGYYSYDLGSWHIVVLNTNCSARA